MAVRNTNSRVNAAEVNEIVVTTLEDSIVDAAINVAYDMVQDNLIGKGLSTNALRNIELYLAGHLVAIIEGQAQEEEIAEGEYRIRFSGTYGEGLRSTRQGQMALALDTTGTLAKIGKLPAGFIVFNTPKLSSPIDDLD